MKTSLILFLLICLITASSFAQTSMMDFYQHRVKEIQNSIGNPSQKPTLKIKDERNGFLSYDLNSTAIVGFEQMAYFVSNNGRKFVAVVSFGCGPLCSSGFPIFFELKNKQLINQTEKYLPKNIANQINQFYVEATPKLLDRIKAEDTKYLNTTLDDIPLTTWVKVPQFGTTIQFGLMEGGDETGKFYLIAELLFNPNDGSFRLVKK